MTVSNETETETESNEGVKHGLSTITLGCKVYVLLDAFRLYMKISTMRKNNRVFKKVG